MSGAIDVTDWFGWKFQSEHGNVFSFVRTRRDTQVQTDDLYTRFTFAMTLK